MTDALCNQGTGVWPPLAALIEDCRYSDLPPNLEQGDSLFKVDESDFHSDCEEGPNSENGGKS
jgi:hypothetical protein